MNVTNLYPPDYYPKNELAETISYPDKVRAAAIEQMSSKLHITSKRTLENIWDAAAEALIENFLKDYATTENLAWIEGERDIEYIIERAVTQKLFLYFTQLTSIDDSDAAIRTLLSQTVSDNTVKEVLEKRILECRTEREAATGIWRYLGAILQEQQDNGQGAADEMVVEFQAFLTQYSDVALSVEEILGLIDGVIKPARDPESKRYRVFTFDAEYAAEKVDHSKREFDAATELHKILEQNKLKALETKYYEVRNDIRAKLRLDPEARQAFLQTIAGHKWVPVGYTKDYDLVGRGKDSKINVEPESYTPIQYIAA